MYCSVYLPIVFCYPSHSLHLCKKPKKSLFLQSSPLTSKYCLLHLFLHLTCTMLPPPMLVIVVTYFVHSFLAYSWIIILFGKDSVGLLSGNCICVLIHLGVQKPVISEILNLPFLIRSAPILAGQFVQELGLLVY